MWYSTFFESSTYLWLVSFLFPLFCPLLSLLSFSATNIFKNKNKKCIRFVMFVWVFSKRKLLFCFVLFWISSPMSTSLFSPMKLFFVFWFSEIELSRGYLAFKFIRLDFFPLNFVSSIENSHQYIEKKNKTKKY